jgi:DNA-binding XRE family transcriptional regulator
MESESKYERVKNDQKSTTLEKLSPDKKKEIVWLTEQGHTQKDIEEKVGVSSHTVVAVRQEMGDKDLDLGTYKRKTSELFKSIILKGAHRLDAEIDKLPITQMPLALAILIDKVQTLNDQPVVVTEHRLKVRHEDINKMLAGEVIDVESLDRPKN